MTQRPSFISEHTAEFYLVPRFQKALSTAFSTALPLFFWSTREGNSISKSSSTEKSVRLCALFARRPKLDGSRHVVMKVNAEVFGMAAELQKAGTPSFVGIPIVHSIFELAENFTCLWFGLRATDQSQPEVYVECESDMVLPSDGALLAPCRDEEICHIIKAQAETTTWEEAIETIRRVQSQAKQTQWHRFPFGPIYKPVYFLVW